MRICRGDLALRVQPTWAHRSTEYLIEKYSIDDLVIYPKGGGRGSVPERLGPGFEEQKEQKQGGSSCFKLLSECNTRLFLQGQKRRGGGHHGHGGKRGRR